MFSSKHCPGHDNGVHKSESRQNKPDLILSFSPVSSTEIGPFFLYNVFCYFLSSPLGTFCYLHLGYYNKYFSWALELPDYWLSSCECHHKSVMYPHFQPNPAVIPLLGFQSPPLNLSKQQHFLLLPIINRLLSFYLWCLSQHLRYFVVWNDPV